MQRYRLPLIREVPIPTEEEAMLPQSIEHYYLAREADARIAELEKAMREYGMHLSSCSGWSSVALGFDPTKPCDCGLTRFL